MNKGRQVCKKYGIELVQRDLEIDEVQSEDIEYVARKKVEAAFSLLREPVVISDDAWVIHGLNGFPGTYAKSVNTWFTPADYIRLTKDLADRRVTLVQTLVYQDEHGQHFFKRETVGALLKEPSGQNGATIQKIVSMESDSSASISDVMGGGTHYSGEDTLRVWHNFASWLTGEQK